MHLRATSSSQGGVQFYGNPQTYGMYLVRMKGDYEPGLSINNLAILWPSQQGVWPPEVDFFQDLGGSRQSFSASLHVGPNGNGDCCVIAQSHSGQQRHGVAYLWRRGHRARSPTRSTGGSGPASPAVRSVPPRNGPPFL